MTKTIDQMVKELDSKFDGLISACLDSLDNDPCFEGNHYHVFMRKITCNKVCTLQIGQGYRKGEVSEVIFHNTSMDKAITKAHKHFIENGEDL